MRPLILNWYKNNKSERITYHGNEVRIYRTWQGQKGSISPAGSVGASASQRSPPETRTPRHAVLEDSILSLFDAV